MRILILGLNYAPEPIGIGPYSAALAEYLASRGHAVTCIAGNPYYPDWKLADGFEHRESVSDSGGVRIIRVPHYIPARPTALRRIVHHISYAKNARKAAKRCGSYDAVLAIAPSLIAAPVALNFAQRTGAVSWLHIQDFEVEAALATGLLARGPIATFARKFEEWVISNFDWVSAISGMMVAKAINKGADPARCMELRNWAEPSVRPETQDFGELRAHLGIPPGTIALYSGNLARKQGSELIAHAAQLLSSRSDVQFVVCGSGPAKASLQTAAMRLANLHVRDLQPRDRLNALLSLADIHILPQIADAADLVLPSKLANMLASGRPVVVTAAQGTSLAHEVEGCGIVVPPGDAQAFADAIALLAHDGGMRHGLGLAAAARAEQRWSSAVLLKKFALSLENAVDRQVLV